MQVQLSGSVHWIWFRPFRVRSTSVSYAHSVCENPASGDVYVCGTVSGHKTTLDADGLVFAVTAAGVPLWQVYHDLGGSVDEYRDIRFTTAGNIIVCGFSNAAAGGVVGFNDTWVSLFDPAAMPAAAGMLWSFKHRFAGPVQETKGYRVIEGKNVLGATTRYYVVGPVYPSTGLAADQMMLEIFGAGAGTYHEYAPPYGPLGFDDRFGLDSIEMSTTSPGLAIFSRSFSRLPVHSQTPTCSRLITTVPPARIIARHLRIILFQCHLMYKWVYARIPFIR